ncbi:hypothetical protein [Burkholderia sp. LMG 21824]|uniref:hypothetical protein n=1 Tax=Burkholderia sp. LMG 21824 TaxID=3158172 RepID=UPI003C2ED612
MPNGNIDMIPLGNASEPPNSCRSDGNTIVASPTCNADTMPASTTFATAARSLRDGSVAASAATGDSGISPSVETAACNGMRHASEIGLPHMIQIEVHFK